jgi:probable HAF family extracellular repeat protein
MHRHLLLALLLLGIMLSALATAQDPSYTFTTLDVPFPGAHDTGATGINNHGQIVGGYLDSRNQDQGFLDNRGVFTTILNTEPQGINNQGQITGFYSDGRGLHGFLYDSGVYTTLDVSGANLTLAAGINDRGQIVGVYEDSNGVSHGFLYDAGVFTTFDVPGASLTEGRGINNRGQIVGRYLDSNTINHGFVATPTTRLSTAPH